MKLLKIALAALIATAFASTATAHATLETQEAQVGSYYKAVVRIGHGCNGEATLKLRVEIPEGVIAVKPMPKAGWTLETTEGAYENTYLLHGREMSAGVKEITWTGELADAHYDEFIFRAKLDTSLPAEEMLFFPTVQECASGQNAWIEIPTAGQDPHDLNSPAPSLMLKAAPHHNH